MKAVRVYSKDERVRRKLKQRIYWKKNRAAILERARIKYAEFRKQNPLPEKTKQTKAEKERVNKEWKKRNPEKVLYYARKSYQKRKAAGTIKKVNYSPKQKARHDLYVKNNPEKMLAAAKKRREQLSNSYLRHALKVPASVALSKEILEVKKLQLFIHRELRRMA
jgi:hypothetical protein